MSKIVECKIEDRSALCPKEAFGNSPMKRLAPRSKAPWYGILPKSELGWSDKANACLGLTPETKTIWAPIYFDEGFDHGSFTAFARKNGMPADELASLIVRQWYYLHKEEINAETADWIAEEMDEAAIDKKMKAMENSMKRLEELRAKMKAAK